MTSLKIIFSTLLIAISYGIIHDLITAHLCVEYFTIGHPKIIESQSPILLALVWGVIATWWVALPMGILLASFNYFGKSVELEFKIILKLIVKLIFVMFGIAILAGLIGFLLTQMNVIFLTQRLAEQIDNAKHSKFLAAGWSHTSSYLSGIIGTIVICRKIKLKREKESIIK